MPGEVDKTDLYDRMENFMNDLRKDERLGSCEVARRTVDLLRRLISQTKWTSVQDLMDQVWEAGKQLMGADPSESRVGNMVRRVLKIIREEFVSGLREDGGIEADGAEAPLDSLSVDYTQPCPNLKATVIESIGELLQEIDGSAENIAQQALEHIHADETIMTFGGSKTVEAFLKNAGRKRKFHVICTEGDPQFGGQTLAKNLAAADINVTLVPNSHVFAMMARVNKVIIGTHTILAEGGLKAPCGIFNMALAAKEHKVPVFVCASTYKLSPEQFRSEVQEGFQKYVDPNVFYPLEEFAGIEGVEFGNVVYEHIDPEYIHLFIFNTGTNAPSYVYRLVKELYHPDDLDLNV
ncbi:translation initiation factor eIF2B subunit beta-like [Littorina saxatilis]|uniref:Translation initiation factor eIF2B subunit beta n=1 Tax=Littorina saxatilis TaxID=31220 RepID=A0AAN9B8F5_9CAEN